MEKKYKIFHAEDCPNCGDQIEVLSEFPEEKDTEFEQWFMDGEYCRCVAECGFVSHISADGDNVYMQEGNIDELNERQKQFE
jgi:hypothetical protein